MTVSKKTLFTLVALDKLMEVEVENEIIESLLMGERKPVNVRYTKKKTLLATYPIVYGWKRRKIVNFQLAWPEEAVALLDYQSHKSNVNF